MKTNQFKKSIGHIILGHKVICIAITTIVIIGTVSSVFFYKNLKVKEVKEVKESMPVGYNIYTNRVDNGNGTEPTKVENEGATTGTTTSNASTATTTTVTPPGPTTSDKPKVAAENSSSGSTSASTKAQSTPTPLPTPTPTPTPAPVRASGIDQALTDKLNVKAHTVAAYNNAWNNGKSDELIQSCKNIVLGGSVVEDIRTPWAANSLDPTNLIGYKGQSVNVVTGETEYYYTRFGPWNNGIGGFSYVIAYWEDSINNYKLYYIRITLN